MGNHKSVSYLDAKARIGLIRPEDFKSVNIFKDGITFQVMGMSTIAFEMCIREDFSNHQYLNIFPVYPSSMTIIKVMLKPTANNIEIWLSPGKFAVSRPYFGMYSMAESHIKKTCEKFNWKFESSRFENEIVVNIQQQQNDL